MLASSSATCSAGLWLTPPRQRTKIMPISATSTIAMPSCPAPLGSSNTACPSAATAAASCVFSQGAQGTLRALAAHRVEPQRTLEIGSTEAIKQAVAAGVGVAIVSVATIDDQVRLGKLKVIPIKGVHIERTLWQLKSPGRLDVPAAVAFEGIIRETKGTKATPRASSAKVRRTDPAPTPRHARS